MTGILKISEAASLGLHAMMVLARDPEARLAANELSAVLHSSEATLAKVLQQLARAGLVNSTRGPKGGFLLGRPPEEINLLEIYEAIEGPLDPVGCLLQQPVCPGGNCVFGSLMKHMHGMLAQHMKKTTLAPTRGGGKKS